MAEILSHPWMQGEMATEAQIKEEFSKRDQMVKAA
jgi:hypothetical protein